MSRPPAQAASEKETILRAQRYEPEALSDLFDAHFDDLYRYLDRMTGNAGLTEDLARRVWLRALEGLPRYRRFESDFTTWLERIANSLLAAEVRPAEAGDSPEAQLRRAVRGLTPDQLDVIGLRFLAGLPAAQVARATGRSRGRVDALQHRALLALREALAPEPPPPAEAG